MREEVHRWAHVLTPLNHELEFSTSKKNQTGINRKLLLPTLSFNHGPQCSHARIPGLSCVYFLIPFLLSASFTSCPFPLFLPSFSSSHGSFIKLIILSGPCYFPAIILHYKPSKLASILNFHLIHIRTPGTQNLKFSFKDALEKFS